MGESMQAGRLAARAIKANGVDTLFTLSGGHVMPIYEGCRVEGVRVLDVRHEQAAAHAAEAWGRVNRACGVALVTSGPGVTGRRHRRRELQGRADAARRDRRRPPARPGGAGRAAGARPALDLQADHEVGGGLHPPGARARPASRPPSATRSPSRAGPVYLELPMDILFADAEEERPAAPSRSAARAFGDPKEMTKAADLLTNAERPAVIAGSGIWWDGAWKQLAAFAENGRLPVYLNGSGRGALPPDHELFFQHSRSSARRGRRRRLRHRDAARLPAQVRALQPGGEARPRPCRSDRARPQPRAGCRDRRRLRGRARDPGRRRQEPPPRTTTGSSGSAPPRRRGGTRTAPRSSRTAPRSTTTASARSSTACSTPARS